MPDKKNAKKTETVKETAKPLKKKALVRDLSMYQTVLDTLPVMCWVKDLNNQTLYANKAAQRFDQRHAPQPTVAPNGTEAAAEEAAATSELAAVEAVTLESLRRGMLHSHSDAETGATLWLVTDEYPCLNEDGSLGGVIVVTSDATETQNALVAAEAGQRKVQHLRDRISAVLAELA